MSKKNGKSQTETSMPKTKMGLEWAHPLVQSWFSQYIGFPTEPQQLGWPSILKRKDTLISAPTGSGKTLAAFLVCIDELVHKALQGNLSQETLILYVSPLKALGNDIQKNLMLPLEQMTNLAKEQHIDMQAIDVRVRTGDTPTKERQAMLRSPPHILVTTPESLYILLTAGKSLKFLQSIHTVIVDEIHALLNNKRGAHFALSLERLEQNTKSPPLRIGLSATQKPLDTVARFLTGSAKPKACIISIGHAKHLELSIEVPKTRLEAVTSNQQWDEIYDKLAELIQTHRSTLIFANTRRIAERTAHHLGERMDPSLVCAHHGSLSKKLRLTAESKLKKGELKALVATASLELGIDIGQIDLVCQLGSPRSIAVMLQRVGRSGHWHGAVSKGRLFATTRDDLVECAALVKAIYDGDLDTLVIPEEPLDILSQHMVAACATQDWTVEDLYALIRRAFHYQRLSKDRFLELLRMLSEGISSSRGRQASYLFYDKELGLIKAKRGARLAAIMNGGAIPDNALFTVIIEGTETKIGTLDEDFAVESHRGDIFLLGSTSWRIKQIDASKGRIIVEDAKGASPSVPFWRGEAPERTAELSTSVSQLRELIQNQLQEPETIGPWLETICHLNEYAASQLIQYLEEGIALLGQVPTQSRIIGERFFDEAGGMQLIIHAPFGARINKAWGLALRKCFCRSFNIELQASATDNGLHIALTEQHSFPLADVFNFLHANSFKKNLRQALLQSPIFITRWRWDATRSLAILRYRNGKKIPPYILRMISDDLLAAVFPDAAACQDNLAGCDISVPNHPLVHEAIKDGLTEALDMEGMHRVLRKIEAGSIVCLARDTPVASVFSHELLNANPFAYLDDAPLEERRARAVEMRQILPKNVLESLGRLDPMVIQEVQKQIWPDIRSADELQDFLQEVIAFPVHGFKDKAPIETHFFDELLASKRVLCLEINQHSYWVPVSEASTFHAVYGLKPDEEALFRMLRVWMPYLGPISSIEISTYLNLTQPDIDQALVRIESTGLILRGSFLGNTLEWCERRILARIHRLTIQALRKEITPLTREQFFQWLLHWQHLAVDAKLQGERGLLEVIDQLQGFEIGAKFWEKEIFAKRVKDYSPDLLDRLCLMGTVGWGRFSPISSSQQNGSIKRVIPNSIAPIAFFVRKESLMLTKNTKLENNAIPLTAVAAVVRDYLQSHGAAFLSDIVEDTRHLKAEVEMALWELVTAGMATADSFDNLRALIDPRRRLRKKRYRVQTVLNSGRWSLLKFSNVSVQDRVLMQCKVLLKRYGVVYRDLLAKEKLMFNWSSLLEGFRSLETRAEIRGGRFIEGVGGEQFALAYAVESLRAFRKTNSAAAEIMLHPQDPLYACSVNLAALSGFAL